MNVTLGQDTCVTVELRDVSARLPRKANASDACFDLYSPVAQTIAQGETGVVDLGLAIELEEGWEAQVRGRSGLAKRGVVIHPGTVDCLYRHNVKVLIHNLSGEDYVIGVGDRIAQMKIARVWRVELRAGPVSATDRGGFGSTGR